MVCGNPQVGLCLQVEKYQVCFKHGNPELSSLAGHVVLYLTEVWFYRAFGKSLCTYRFVGSEFHERLYWSEPDLNGLNLYEPCVLYIGRHTATLQTPHFIYFFNKYKY
jgi:hypothetical protein